MWILHTQRFWEDRHELKITVTAIEGDQGNGMGRKNVLEYILLW